MIGIQYAPGGTDFTSSLARFKAANPVIAAADLVILPAADVDLLAEMFFQEGCVHTARVQRELRQMMAADTAGRG